jgi:hypothetical protein
MPAPVAADRRRPLACMHCGALHSRLNPCPFCGHPHVSMLPWPQLTKHGPLRHRVVCPRCGGSGGIHVEAQHAAMTWNQRTRKAWKEECA